MLGFRFYLYSILLHLGLLGAAVFAVDWKERVGLKPDPQPLNALQARRVDKAAVDAEILRMQSREEAKAEALRNRLAELERAQKKVVLETEARRKAEERRAEQARQKAVAEAERLAKLKAEQRTETKRVAQLKAEQVLLAKRKAEQEAEAKRVALAAEKERARRKAEAAKKREEEKRLAAIAARKEAEKKKAEAERKRREAAEAARKREDKKAEEARRQAAALALQAELEAERESLDRQRAKRLSALRREYEDLIGQKVERHWIKQPGFDKDWSCRVRVIQTPVGDVLRVETVSCDGTAAYRNSVIKAVYRAEPLPKPPDPAVFDREILFNFKEP